MKRVPKSEIQCVTGVRLHLVLGLIFLAVSFLNAYTSAPRRVTPLLAIPMAAAFSSTGIALFHARDISAYKRDSSGSETKDRRGIYHRHRDSVKLLLTIIAAILGALINAAFSHK